MALLWLPKLVKDAPVLAEP